MSKAVESKIVDPGLREFAGSTEAADPRSVIIEIAVPSPLVSRKPPEPGRQPFGSRLAIASKDDPRKRMDAAATQIVSVLKQDPVRLDTAEAFVASVSPAELRELLALPVVGMVRPNRTHRVV